VPNELAPGGRATRIPRHLRHGSFTIGLSPGYSMLTMISACSVTLAG
jgi:hypothetical protein